MPSSSLEDDAVLDIAIDQGVAWMTMNRPEVGNSLSPGMLRALEAGWTRLEADPEVRVIVLTGAGDKHFCTGADVAGVEVGKGGLHNVGYAEANRFSPRMCHVSKPVICVLNGLVNAGGLHFVADADIVIAAGHVTFMDTHVSIGLVSALESIGLARRAGVGAALLLGLCGREYRMPVERAYQLGIVDLLEPDTAAARARAATLAGMISRNSPRAVALTKRAIWTSTEMPDPAAPVHGWELLKSQWSHPDFEEGPRAFLERREAVWDPDPNARRKD